jgi:hypothetical protein
MCGTYNDHLGPEAVAAVCVELCAAVLYMCGTYGDYLGPGSAAAACAEVGPDFA